MKCTRKNNYTFADILLLVTRLGCWCCCCWWWWWWRRSRRAEARIQQMLWKVNYDDFVFTQSGQSSVSCVSLPLSSVLITTVTRLLNILHCVNYVAIRSLEIKRMVKLKRSKYERKLVTL